MFKKILITGASSGFGRLMAERLMAQGHKVVASMRDPKGKNKASAQQLKSKGSYIVDIDVTSEQSVEKGVQKAIEMAGGLDVVVNNAGVGVIGMQEHFTADDWQKLFDINVFGVQRINRAVIPHFREQNSGLIISVTSLLGRMTLPFYGPYNASKWALEALAENYRVELSGFGIDSCIIEPGGFPTDFFDKLMKPSDKSRDKSYGDFINAPIQMFENFERALKENPAQKPELVADAVVELVSTPSGQRPFRTVVDKMGMGDHLIKYNEQLEQIMNGIYNSFSMGDMLKVKS